jgi:hypothetical protein
VEENGALSFFPPSSVGRAALDELGPVVVDWGVVREEDTTDTGHCVFVSFEGAASSLGKPKMQ